MYLGVNERRTWRGLWSAGRGRWAGAPGRECNRLFYKKGCQEHSSPFAVSAVLVRDIQPLVTTEDASLGLCPWV